MPVVVLASSAEPREVAQCYQAGANSCIRKPVEFREFTETFGTIGRYWLRLNRAAPAARGWDGVTSSADTSSVIRAEQDRRDSRRPDASPLTDRCFAPLRMTLVPHHFPRLPCRASPVALAPSLFAAPLAAQSAVDIPYQRFTAARTGLPLLVHEDHKAPIVAVNVWYHVGSKNERPGRTGFAHLFEHLMFNGSEHYDKEFQGPLERAGATDLNGTTNEDRTNYFENVPSSALDLALWLESDRMGHLVGAISQAKLDEQRGVVQNEKRQGENEPYGKVWDFLTPRLYPANHPYSWTVIGSMEDLDAAKLDDVKGWFQTLLRPVERRARRSPATSTPTTAKAKVERYFGDIPAGPPVARQESWIAKRTGRQRGRDAGPGAAGAALQGVERARSGAPPTATT